MYFGKIEYIENWQALFPNTSSFYRNKSTIQLYMSRMYSVAKSSNSKTPFFKHYFCIFVFKRVFNVLKKNLIR